MAAIGRPHVLPVEIGREAVTDLAAVVRLTAQVEAALAPGHPPALRVAVTKSEIGRHPRDRQLPAAADTVVAAETMREPAVTAVAAAWVVAAIAVVAAAALVAAAAAADSVAAAAEAAVVAAVVVVVVDVDDEQLR